MSSLYSPKASAPTSPMPQEFSASSYSDVSVGKLAGVENSEGEKPSSVANPSIQGVVGSKGEVHAQGYFYELGPELYKNNLTAIKSLLNEKNDLLNEKKDLLNEKKDLAAEKEKLLKKLNTSVDPVYVRVAAGISTMINIVAVIIVSIGVNLVTADTPPRWAEAVLGLGVLLTIIATFYPTFVAFFPEIFKKSKKDE